MGEEQVIKILMEFSKLFVENDIISWTFQWIGWFLIKIVAEISDLLQDITNKVYTLLDFFNYTGVTEIITMFKPVVWSILLISIVCLVYNLMLNRRYKADNLMLNVIMAIIVITLTSGVMVELSKITSDGVQAISSEYKYNSNEIIKNNLVDLSYLDKNNFSSVDLKNNLNVEYIRQIQITEAIDSSKAENKDVFKNRLTMDPDSGEQKLEKLSKVFGIYESKYFRYHYNFLIIFITLLCQVVIQVFVIIKVGRIIFDLGISRIYIILSAFSDLTSGQRLKQIVQYTISMFAVIFVTALTLRLFIVFTGWLTTKDVNAVLQVLMLISAAWAVIDGADIIERSLGIDAGVKSSAGVIAGSVAGVKLLTQSVRNIEQGLSSIDRQLEKMNGGGNSGNQAMNEIMGGNSKSEMDTDINDTKDTDVNQNIDNKDDGPILDKDFEANPMDDMGQDIDHANIDQIKDDYDLDSARDKVDGDVDVNGFDTFNPLRGDTIDPLDEGQALVDNDSITNDPHAEDQFGINNNTSNADNIVEKTTAHNPDLSDPYSDIKFDVSPNGHDDVKLDNIHPDYNFDYTPGTQKTNLDESTRIDTSNVRSNTIKHTDDIVQEQINRCDSSPYSHQSRNKRKGDK